MAEISKKALDPRHFRKVFIRDHLHFDKQRYDPSEFPGSIGKLSPERIQLLFDLALINNDLPGSYSQKGNDFIYNIVDGTNKKFKDSLDLSPTGATIVCGSTANVDNISYLKNNESAQQKIDKALDDAVNEGKLLGQTKENVLKEITSIIDEKNPNNLPNIIGTKAQVLGYVLRMLTKKGGRVQLADLDEKPGSSIELGKWIDEVFSFEASKVGGAAAQIGDFLSGIGEQNVIIHSTYISDQQTKAFNNEPLFLRFEGDQLKLNDKLSAAKKDDPTKTNHIVERAETIVVNFNGREIRATDSADRFIFLSQIFDENGVAIPAKPILDFSDQQLAVIGKMSDVFITTTPSYLQRCEPKDYPEMSKILAKQFDILKDSGVKIIYEFSGNTTNINFLEDVIKGRVASFSLNDDELNELTQSAIKNGYIENGKKEMSTFDKAFAIAKWLQVERLHVHGHNIDISIRKNPSEDDMMQEVRALMHAKQRVIEWIKGQKSVIQTPPEDRLSEFLKVEGYRQLLFLANELSEKAKNDNTVLESKLIYQLLTNNYCQVNNEYWVAAIPVKWLYDIAKRTTSSGDIISSVAAIHALKNKK